MASFKRGTIAITGAKMLFLAAGWILVVSLGSLLTPEQFGVYSVLFAVVSLINMVLIYGTMQTVSHFVASKSGSESAVRRRAFVFQAVFALPAIALFVIGAPLIAGFLRDDSLTPLLRAAATITLIYAFYAINIGYLNGRRWFERQASLDVAFSIFKVGLIVLLVWLGHGIPGVIIGFASAAFLVFLLSFVLVGKPDGSDKVDLPPATFARFGIKVLAVALLLNFAMQADIFLLKRLSDPSEADRLAGFYGASQNIARLPYFILVTASLVMFPTLARLKGDAPEVRAARSEVSSRAIVMVLGLVSGICAIVAPIADRVLVFLFPPEYAAAAGALAWLLPGVAALSLLNLSVSMVSGAGRPGVSTMVLLGALVAQGIACSTLIPMYGITGAAAGTTIAVTLAFGAVLFWQHRNFGTRVPLRALATMLVAATAAGAISLSLDGVLPEGRLYTLIILAVAFAAQVLVLVVGGVATGAGAASKPRVLLVSKPLQPPLNDGGKTFVAAVAGHLDRDDVAVVAAKPALARELLPDGVVVHRAWLRGGSFGGRLLDNAFLFGWLLLSRYDFSALHFFFAPNKLTCTALRWLRRLSPGLPFVQTVLSRPKEWSGVGDLLFGDLVTVGSQDAVTQIAEATGTTPRLVRPGIDVQQLQATDRAASRGALDLKQEAFHLLFAGDVDHGGGLEQLATMVPPLMARIDNLCLHFSIRTKRAETAEKAQRFVDEHLANFGDRVVVHRDHADFATLLAAMDAQVMPCEDLYTKVDAPLVCLEAMAHGQPVFFLDRAPMNEIPPPALGNELLAADAEALAEKVATWSAGKRPEDAAEILKSHVAEHFGASRAARQYGAIHGEIRN